MFRFAHPDYLYLLILLPVLTGLFWWINRRQRRRLEAFGDPRILASLMSDASPARTNIHFYLSLAALGAAILLLAGPQFGAKLEKVKRQGADLIVALDVSRSMMSEDIQPSRMEKSKQTLSKLIDAMVDDRLGLVVFAGEAYVQLPVTADYVSAKMFLSSVSTDLVPVQGTAIGAAIDMALRSFDPQSKAEKAIVVITDGENHEGNAAERAAAAASQGIRVHVVGMGSPKGSPIPTGKANDFHKDKDGNVVISRLNEEMCQEIAKAGNGLYVRSDNTNAALKVLLAELDKMTKAESESMVYTEYDEQFPVAAWMVLALLLIDAFILERRNDRWKNFKLF